MTTKITTSTTAAIQPKRNEATGELSLPASGLRALLERAKDPLASPKLSPELKAEIEKAIAEAKGGEVPLSRFEGDLGREFAAAMLSPTAGAVAPQKSMFEQAAPKAGPAVAGVLQDSPLNPAGVGNVSGTQANAARIPGMTIGRDDQMARVDPRNPVADPNTVARFSSVADPDVVSLVRGHYADGGKRVAEYLAKKYGPFTAANSEQNRREIVRNLIWIADTSKGLDYDTPRASSSDVGTQSPNATLAKGTGVCRDIHVATSAILASLINAKPGADGRYVAGPPTGQEAHVQTLGFGNPDEYHAYMVFRDPGTNRWSALEYNAVYDLGANKSLDAFRNLPGYMSGYSAFTITGWDSPPSVSALGVLGAREELGFFKDDAGVGKPGEFRLAGDSQRLALTGFLTPRLSATAQINPEAVTRGEVTGGAKLNWHKDFQDLDKQGYVRVGAGFYTKQISASVSTGQRGADGRVDYQVYVIGAQIDGRVQGNPRQLIGDHLKLRYGADLEALASVPFASGGDQRFGIVTGALGDYNKLNVGLDGGFSGHEKLSRDLTLDWAVNLRYRPELVAAGTELIASKGKRAEFGLLKDPPRAEFALALTHQANGVTTRFEAGGTQFLLAPYDKQVSPTGVHHAVLTLAPNSQTFNLQVAAQGEQIDGRFVPIKGMGVAFSLNPNDKISIGAGASTQFGGDWKRFGDNLMVSGNLTVKF